MPLANMLFQRTQGIYFVVHIVRLFRNYCQNLSRLWRGVFSNLLILVNQFWLIMCFFHNPHQFYDEYTRQFPSSWTAVSWEYVAALDIWLSDVKKADTLPAVLVLAAMKQMKDVKHFFGLA